jgi:hypothetical protein
MVVCCLVTALSQASSWVVMGGTVLVVGATVPVVGASAVEVALFHARPVGQLPRVAVAILARNATPQPRGERGEREGCHGLVARGPRGRARPGHLAACHPRPFAPDYPVHEEMG